jgi:Protein of unknown function (DUF3048) N-terminal domain/Protein of unknown function (DUF3048) C-terminal domain
LRYLLIPLFVIVALGGAIYAYSATHRNNESPLSGASVSGSVAERRPIAVIFDNIIDAQPQTGLDKADLVFETLAEGGVTRLMAVYQQQDAPVLGPIRSTRFYFNSWAAGLGVIFGHDGGNVDALQELPHLSTIFSIDADAHFGPFYRIDTRPVPHNEYTSTARLRLFAEAQGASTTGIRYSLPHKSDAPLSQRPASFTLHVQLSYDPYDVTWTYDRQRNVYLRSTNAGPFVEASTNKQIAAKNVVVMMSKETSAPDPFTLYAIHMQTEGSGHATIYEDGQVIHGSWEKPTVDSPLRWVDLDGNPINIDRGTTWVEVVPIGNSVTTGK